MTRAKGKVAAIRALEGRCARLEAENAMLRNGIDRARTRLEALHLGIHVGNTAALMAGAVERAEHLAVP